ncbi:MAG TPA: antitoxin [Mycobacteriales bacterium]|nr:antitoxin [Mycobacteriales bacterium]
MSLSEDDLAVLDEYAHAAGLRSRSAAMQHAIRLLRYADLEEDYAAAWNEWESSGEEAAWADAADDGLRVASR